MRAAYPLNEHQEAWLYDLETTTARQGVGALKTKDHEGPAYCCLGRAEVVIEDTEPEINRTTRLSDTSQEKLKLRTVWGHLESPVTKNGKVYHSLDAMNDSGDWTFAEIAAFIRANPNKVWLDGKSNG